MTFEAAAAALEAVARQLTAPTVGATSDLILGTATSSMGLADTFVEVLLDDDDEASPCLSAIGLIRAGERLVVRVVPPYGAVVIGTLATEELWEPWDVTFAGGVTLGNGTFVDAEQRYGRDGSWEGHFSFVLGTTSAITGGVTVNLPVTGRFSTRHGTAQTAYDDATGSTWTGTGHVTSTTAVLRSGAGSTNLSATVPFTWAVNDTLSAWIRTRV